jgi:hypothetical protein
MGETDKGFAPISFTIWSLSFLFLLAILSYHILPFEGETLESSIYFVTILGVASLIFFEIAKHFSFSSMIGPRIRTYSSVVMISLASLGFIVFVSKNFSVAAALTSTVLSIVIIRKFKFARSSAVVIFLFQFIVGQIMAKVGWWQNFDENLFSSFYTFFFFVVALLVSAWWLRSGNKVERTNWAQQLLFLSFLIIAIFASTRQELDFFHWSFYLGPIQLVRQGHWLLWGVPSQYGFLNILLAAILPFKSATTSLYVLNSLSILISAILGFQLLRNGFRNRSTLLFAGLLVFVATFLLPGMVGIYEGPSTYPSTGAFRFLWCYVIIFLCVKYVEACEKKSSAFKFMAAIVAAWTLALFWSIESAVYTSCIFFPFFVLVRWGHPNYEPYPILRRGLFVVRDILIATLLPFFFVAGIWSYYKFYLGHGPDWYAFIEYALAYANGFGVLAVDPNGGVWNFFLILAVLSALAIFAIRRRSMNDFALASAIIGLVWSTASYFVSRSHENNICNLVPIFVLAFSAALFLARRFQGDSHELSLPLIVKIPLSTFFVLACTMTLGNQKAVSALTKQLLSGRSVQLLHKNLPIWPIKFEQALVAAGLDADDEITYIDDKLLPARSSDAPFPNNLWLPIATAGEFAILPEQRQDLYLKRYFESNPSPKGWLITSVTYKDLNMRPLAAILAKYYETPEYVDLSKIKSLQAYEVYKFKKKDTSNPTQELTR